MIMKMPTLSGVCRIALALFLFAAPQTVYAQTFVDLAIHYIQAVPASDGTSYDVSAFVSVIDGDGAPVHNLQVSDFRVVEGSREMQVLSVSPAANEPSHVILLIDSSGSMARKMPAALSAADRFISGLGLNDQVAVLSFNERISEVAELTANLQLARQRLGSISAVNNAGTCLYNAAYEAINQASALPAGRRAIIVLTDGRDETLSGAACSQLTLDDVAAHATSGSRVPIYTIGLGSEIDENALERLSTLTGGDYLFSATEQNLNELFDKLLDQLRSQYVLAYTSTNPPGVISTTIEVNVRGAKDQDKANFVLPALPTRIAILSPTAGEAVKDNALTIDVQLAGQGEPVSQIVIQANGQVIGSISQPPYRLEWDVSSFEPGTELNIVAIAQGGNFQELTRQEVSVHIFDPDNPTQSGNEDSEAEVQAPSEAVTLPANAWIIGAVLAVGLVAAVFLLRRRKQDESSEEFGTMELEMDGRSGSLGDATMDDFGAIGEIYGVLTVLNSDDLALLGKKLDLMKSPTKIGRSPDNDIIFTDKPISRFHATIEKRGNSVVVAEVISMDASGKAKPPTYGTTLNGKKLDGETNLKSGDEIGLGSRAKLRFEAVVQTDSLSDATLDDFRVDDPPSDETQEV